MAKMINFYHTPCRNSGMGFLVPDIGNSICGFYKYQCMNCGKNSIAKTDDDVLEEKVPAESASLVSIKNIDTKKDLMIDGEFLIVFESEDQAKRFAELYNITEMAQYETSKYIYGSKTNAMYEN